jgi:peptide/nickel transport system substrate-binding protein
MSIKLSTTPHLLSKAEKISDYWKELSIETSVSVTSTVPTEYQAFLAIVDIPKDPDQYALWHSTQVETNISKYENPRIDKLLEDGRLELDLEERRKIYLDFQRFLIEDSPATFLFHPVYYSVSRK